MNGSLRIGRLVSFSRNRYYGLTTKVLLVALVLLCDVGQLKAQLPIVRLYSDNLLTSSFTSGHFMLDDSVSADAEIRYRGASALGKTKKSFAIKLKMEDGEKLDVPLLGMRSDNSWILDAMAIDVARMRNRVSMDLWNDFASETYIQAMEESALNGTQGKFVELYLNDEYWGLYCLSEKIDRKQLKLKKIKNDKQRGALYKSFTWSTLYSKDDSFYQYSNSNVKWNGWELSYPDIDDGEPVDWAPLCNTIHWLSYATSREIRDSITSKIDIPVWQDYFLMMEFICAADNMCKNQYVYFYDCTDDDLMLGVAPWDMDYSWGRDYKGDINMYTSSTFSCSPVGNRVFQLFQSNPTVLDRSFEDRYAQLRATYFSADSLKQRFNRYFTLFRETGADERETARWSGVDGIYLNFLDEQTYIENWIDDRIKYMDEKYNYTNTSIAIPTECDADSSTHIYNITGLKVGNNNINGLSKGVYIINGRKVLK